MHTHAGLPQIFGGVGILRIDHQQVEEVAIKIGTPGNRNGEPCAAIRAPAGPVTAAPPTIGLTAAMRARLSRSASRIPGTARIGAMLVTGLLGASSTRSAERIASVTPGAGSASEAPANRTDSTGS
jgi:hypothetical protein